jgi:hypothetical protein
VHIDEPYDSDAELTKANVDHQARAKMAHQVKVNGGIDL